MRFLRNAAVGLFALTTAACSSLLGDFSSGGSGDGGGTSADASMEAAMNPEGSSGSSSGGGGDSSVHADAGEASVVVKQGQACPAGTTCESGSFCVDGYCCSSQCTDACNACNVTGKEGTCSPIAKGDAPETGHAKCGTGTPDPTTCQDDGKCDGTGHCELYPLGTVCKASSCNPNGNIGTPASTCDGSGNCTTPGNMACAPYACNGTTACYTSCTTSAQCEGTNSCVNMSCGPKSNGAMCSMGAECASGNCADGVCCNTTCTAGCMACNLAATLGTCTNVPSGQDPHGACPTGVGANATCSPGGCNGNDNCIAAPTTTQCQTSTCSSGVETDPAYCQSNGTCAQQGMTTCSPYTCVSGACATTCGVGSPCASGYYCNASSACVPQLTAGEGCSATAQCQSGLTCLDGVCCGVANCPQCLNCGASGTCNVTVASGPDNTGAVCNGTQVCSATGACLGALGSGCGSGSNCASGNCVDGVCCNVAACPACSNCTAGTGNGTCSTPVVSQDDTTPNVCDKDNSCNASGGCVARWSALATIAVDSQPNYFDASSTKLYFANADNLGGGVTQYFKSYDVSTSAFASESLTNEQMCECGYSGMLVHANNSLFYAGNTPAVYYEGTGTGWVSLSSYPSGPYNGEVGTTANGLTLWRFGGRGPVSAVYSYTFTSASPTGGAWSATGAHANMPIALQSTCEATYNGNIYVWGGYASSSNAQTFVYNVASNGWTTLPASGNFPGGCYLAEGFVWRSQIVSGDSSGQALWIFNPASNTWSSTTVPLPAASTWAQPVVPSDGNLYLISWSSSGASVTIYKWVLN